MAKETAIKGILNQQMCVNKMYPNQAPQSEANATSAADPIGTAPVAIDQAQQHQTHAVTHVDADPDLPHRGFAGDARRDLLADLVHFEVDEYIAVWQYSHMAMDMQDDHLSLAFAALADPTRRAILARLASGDADVSELMKPFALSQPTISKHLNVLERAGLVRRMRDAQRRPRTLVAVPLKDVAEWLEPFRRFWEQKFASLDDYLKEMQKKEKTRGREKR